MQTSRDVLYGDAPLAVFSGTGTDYPWTSLRSAASAMKEGHNAEATSLLRRVAADMTLEARLRLEAWSGLRELGAVPTAAEAARLEGVVVDVIMPTGHDTLAVYADKSAVYINQSGKAVYVLSGAAYVPEMDAVLAAGGVTLTKIGRWAGPRPAMPGPGSLRISLLTAWGLSFGQGPIDVLAADPIGGPVFTAAVALLQKIVAGSARVPG